MHISECAWAHLRWGNLIHMTVLSRVNHPNTRHVLPKLQQQQQLRRHLLKHAVPRVAFRLRLFVFQDDVRPEELDAARPRRRRREQRRFVGRAVRATPTKQTTSLLHLADRARPRASLAVLDERDDHGAVGIGARPRGVVGVPRKPRVRQLEGLVLRPRLAQRAPELEDGQRVPDEGGTAVRRHDVGADVARDGRPEQSGRVARAPQEPDGLGIEKRTEIGREVRVERRRRRPFDADDVRRDRWDAREPTEDVRREKQVIGAAVDSDVREGFRRRVVGEAERREPEHEDDGFHDARDAEAPPPRRRLLRHHTRQCRRHRRLGALSACEHGGAADEERESEVRRQQPVAHAALLDPGPLVDDEDLAQKSDGRDRDRAVRSDRRDRDELGGRVRRRVGDQHGVPRDETDAVPGDVVRRRRQRDEPVQREAQRDAQALADSGHGEQHRDAALDPLGHVRRRQREHAHQAVRLERARRQPVRGELQKQDGGAVPGRIEERRVEFPDHRARVEDGELDAEESRRHADRLISAFRSRRRPPRARRDGRDEERRVQVRGPIVGVEDAGQPAREDEQPDGVARARHERRRLEKRRRESGGEEPFRNADDGKHALARVAEGREREE
mmetsp:Transcript_17388/g.69865  ORF Transcript_17388/g.69865 Transcript_17388/m.69865 type:complete len:617 (+) Transcript_17388:753-2603(+)